MKAATLILILFVELCLCKSKSCKQMQATSSVNVRKGPSTSNKIVRTLSKGEIVCAYDNNNDWRQVEGLGYVSAKYLEAVSDSSLSKVDKANKESKDKDEDESNNKEDSDKNPLEIYFINSYKGDDIADAIKNDPKEGKQEKVSENTSSTSYDVNEVVILKVADKDSYKYVLLDTGTRNSAIRKRLIKKLKALQGKKKEKPVIDIMIISHLHPDHYGNANHLLTDGELEVKQLIIKNQKNLNDRYISITNNTDPNIIKNITKEGEEIVVGDDVKLAFFNTESHYNFKGKKHCYHNYYGIKYGKLTGNCKSYLYCPEGSTDCKKSSECDNFRFKVNNSDEETFVYFNTQDYFNGKYELHPISEDELKKSKKKYNSKDNGIYEKFFARKLDDRKNCSPNVNSYAIVAKISINNGKDYRYVYFGNDIENGGFDIFPQDFGGFTNVFGSSGFSRVYNGDLLAFDETDCKANITNCFKGLGDETGDKNFLIPSETKAAKEIRKYIVKSKKEKKAQKELEKIVIYQASHHGLNVAPDAANILNLNRTDLFTIFCKDEESDKSFSQVRTTKFTLNQTKKLFVGDYEKGIKCSVSGKGIAKCSKDK